MPKSDKVIRMGERGKNDTTNQYPLWIQKEKNLPKKYSPTTYKNDYIPWSKSLIPEMQGRFSIQKINVKHLINRIKDKKKKHDYFNR